MIISLICYTSLKREDGTYTVLINTSEPKFFPTKEDHAKRIVDFGDSKVLEGCYYILWNADIDQTTRKITAKKITQIQSPKYTVKLDTPKYSESFVLEINDPIAELSVQEKKELLSESILNQIKDPLIYPNNLCLN